MNFLLDTHTFLWALFDDDKLSEAARKAIENPENLVAVSAVNFWEISLKFSIGKLELEGIQPHEIPDIALDSGFEMIPLQPKETSSYHLLKEEWHRDPFDRMLIWQAIQNNLTLISKDPLINRYKEAGLKTLW